MLSTLSSSFREAYQAQIADGAIEPDAAQAEVAEAYAALDQRLAAYKPQRKQGLLSRLFSSDKDEAPRGLYVHGEVAPCSSSARILISVREVLAPALDLYFHSIIPHASPSGPLVGSSSGHELGSNSM